MTLGRGSPSGLIPQTNNSSLGLGASGGPRGAAAGVTQILINFLLNYDKGNSEQLARDIKKFEAERDAANTKAEAAAKKIATLEKQANDARKARNDIGKTFSAQLNEIATRQIRINSLTQQLAKGHKEVSHILDYEKAQQAKIIENVARVTGLSQEQVRLASQLNSIEKQLDTATQRRATAAAEVAAAENNITAAQRAQAAIQKVTGNVGGRLAGLGIGLIGGTIGGALISGALLEPLQAVVNGLAEGLQNLVNPAEAAKEAIKNLSDQVNELVDSDDLSRLDAATQVLERLSAVQAPGSPTLATPENAELLARVALNEHLTKTLQDQLDLLKLQKGVTAQLTDENTQLLLQLERQKQGIPDLLDPFATHVQVLGAILGLTGAINEKQKEIALAAGASAQGLLEAQSAADALAASAEEAARAIEEAANAAADMRQELAQSAIEDLSQANIASINAQLDATISAANAAADAAIDRIRARYDGAIDRLKDASANRIDAIQDKLRHLELQPSGRTKGLERQLDALKDAEPSKRTNELAEAIERLNRATERKQFQAQLDDLDEQKHAILLRERLRLTKEQINLDDFKGKDRLIAIDALLAKQRDQNEAQDRFNKLLDIQYQLQQGVRRQQGETIQEFIQRRAQYYRGLLQQADELNREGPQKELEAERDRVSASIELKEIEERRRKLIEDRARQQRLDDLQAQLKASQDRDRKELEARRDSLQKQLEASRKADQDALESRREALQKQIEAEREQTQRRVEQLQTSRDKAIETAQESRDRAIEAAKTAADRIIEAEERKAEQLKKWADYAATQQTAAAFRGAKDVAELERFAGALAGANFSYNYIQSQLNALGVDQATQATVLANVANLIRVYQGRMFALQHPILGVTPGFGMAEGGIFRLNNSNTPLGKDVRWGDGQGDEIGIVLSNKVTQALRESNGGPVIGGDVIFQSQDPWRDSWRFRRTVEDIAKGTFH